MSHAMNEPTPRTTRNGLDLEQLHGTVQLLQEQPALARFEFRASNRWVTGGENRSRIKEFHGAGAEDESRTEAWEFVNGEPPVLLGRNEGANPVEFVLHALAGCITTTMVVHAAARGIDIRRIATELEGDLDLQGFLALDPAVSPAYQGIRVRIDVDADCSDAELDALIGFTEEHSPVCTTLTRPVPVTLERTKR